MFRLLKKSRISSARLGLLRTGHGKIATPFFMPVATQGVVKHLGIDEIKRLKMQILLSNTYHLMLRPGADMIRRSGGLHGFMNWDGPILTDSGGFQVFSLAEKHNKSGKSLVRLTEKGVEFRSYIDGSKYFLSPEKSLEIQNKLGVDIAVCLDECVALPAKTSYILKSVELTTEWARRSKFYHKKLRGVKPLLFAVIQGGLDKELRMRSLRELIAIGFDGYNIGGLSVGESSSEMYAVLDYLSSEMPNNKPRYLMGVGYPDNIVAGVKRGIDMFDCVIPTREGRHGRLFLFDAKSKYISSEKNFYKTININNSKFVGDFSVINKNSKIPILRNYSRSYLHYLFKINEPLGQRLATLNNLEFYLDLMKKIRYSIKLNKF